MLNMDYEPVGEPSSFEVNARSHETLLIGLVLVLAALVYAPSLRFTFVLDDWWQFVQNEWVQSWRFVPGYFRGHVWPHLGTHPPANYYRPVTLIWFQIVHTIFGLWPAGWHASAILLHLLVTFLGYQVVRRISGRVLVASAAALTFAIHPMRHDVVGWLSGMTESFWSVLFLAAFLAYLQSREGHRWRWLLASYFLYAAALLSKEPAIVLPVIVCTHAWLYGAGRDAEARPEWGRRIWEATRFALPYVPIAAAYLVARLSVLRAFSHPKVELSLGSLALSLPSVAFFYARQWLAPYQTSEFYPLSTQSHFNAPYVLLPLLALATIAAVLWFERERLGRREVIFASVWMGALILPSLDLGIYPAGDIVHDRYFYLGSLGASFLLGLAVDRLAAGPAIWFLPKRWLLASLALLALLSFATVDAMSYWVDDYAVLDHAMLYSPNNPNVRNLLSVSLAFRGRDAYTRGDWTAAETYLRRARSLDPMAADNYLQLGMVDLNTGRAQQAEENFRAAIVLRPAEPMFHFALGIALAQRNNCTDARVQFAQTLALRPDFAGTQPPMDACESRMRNNPALASQSAAKR
jgi:protein O-mannosyl-transferase